MNIVNENQLKQLLGANIGSGPDLDDHILRILLLIGKGLFLSNDFFNRAERLATDVQVDIDGLYHVGMEDRDREQSEDEGTLFYNPRSGETEPRAVDSTPDKEKDLIWIGEAAYDWNVLGDVVEMIGVCVWRINELFKLLPKLIDAKKLDDMDAFELMHLHQEVLNRLFKYADNVLQSAKEGK